MLRIVTRGDEDGPRVYLLVYTDTLMWAEENDGQYAEVRLRADCYHLTHLSVDDACGSESAEKRISQEAMDTGVPIIEEARSVMAYELVMREPPPLHLSCVLLPRYQYNALVKENEFLRGRATLWKRMAKCLFRWKLCCKSLFKRR